METMAPRKWPKIFALATVAFIALLFIAFATSVELISHQRFCRSCHVMETYYDSWANSAHKDASCGECHNLPGFSGFAKSRYKSMVRITKRIIGNYRPELHAEVDDVGCLKANCHDKQTIKDTPEGYSKRKVAFNHKAHLIEQRRGKWLKCTSCHSQIVQGAHMNVTQSTCFLCHFKNTPEDSPISGCPSCHSAPEQLVIHENIEINHKKLLDFDVECSRCHIHLVEGDGKVEKTRCYNCHNKLERLQKYSNSQLIHDTHLTGHELNCFSCHSEIQHKEVEFTELLSTDCQSCHPDHHAAQKELYLGIGGKDVITKPDVMFLAQVGCEGCHSIHKGSEVEGTTFVAKPEACVDCHGEEYADMQEQWKRGIDNLIAQVQPSTELVAQELKKAERAGKNITAAQQLYQEATYNIELVRYGKGVHNVQYSDSLLTTANEKLTKALQLINPSRTIPELLKPQIKEGATCLSCHFGIESKIVEIYDKYLKHGRHLLYAKLDCTTCHSDQPKGEQEHGKLLVTSTDCMKCHHKEQPPTPFIKGETKADCLQCHENAKTQVVVYQGKNLDHQSHVDKSRFIGGAGEEIQCNTCHASDIKQSFKGECAPCHHDAKQIADKTSFASSVVYCESCHPIQTAMYKGLRYNLPSMKFDAKVDCVKCHKLDAISGMTLARCYTDDCHKKVSDYATIMDTWQANTRNSTAQAEILEQKIEKLLTDWDVPEAKQLYRNAKEALDFVRKDGSLGVHHPELVDKLMKNSIEQLQQSLQLLTNKIRE